MEPRTITVGEKHQNGDVESLNGALKRRLNQHLLLRSTRDFDSLEQYELWLEQVIGKANRVRSRKLKEELGVMNPITVGRVPEFIEQDIRVTSRSSICIKRNVYSVPSRLIGEIVRVRIYDDRLEVYYGGTHQLTMERLLGRGGRRINYRDIIWSLVRKPGAFRLFKYQQDLFPTLTFRQAYDTLCKVHDDRKASLEYLRILHLAASTVESEVEAALQLVLEEGPLTGMEQIKALIDATNRFQPPQMATFKVDLSCYDALLHSQEVAS